MLRLQIVLEGFSPTLLLLKSVAAISIQRDAIVIIEAMVSANAHQFVSLV